MALTLLDIYEEIETNSGNGTKCPTCMHTKTKMLVCGHCLETYENNHKKEIETLMKRIEELEDYMDIKYPNNPRWT